MRHRGTVRRVKNPYLGESDTPGMPVKLSAWPAQPDVKAPLLGQDNENVLGELLDLPDDEIASLYAQGVLVRDPKLGPLT